MQDLNLELKRFDTLHDFGNTASNRSAQIGLNYLGITMPEISGSRRGRSYAERPSCRNGVYPYKG